MSQLLFEILRGRWFGALFIFVVVSGHIYGGGGCTGR